MTIEEAEYIFGARWDSWGVQEQEEFVSVLEPHQLKNPVCLRLAYSHSTYLSDDAKDLLRNVLFRA